jgi:hypothetical protein
MATGTDTEGATKMENSGQSNRSFLESLDAETSGMILGSIAEHYGNTVEVIFDEVVCDKAHGLLEYMIEPMRSATSVLMQRFNARKAA